MFIRPELIISSENMFFLLDKPKWTISSKFIFFKNDSILLVLFQLVKDGKEEPENI
jgi:hypothetical protein